MHYISYLALVSYFVQVCTGFIFCASLHRFLILCNFAQIPYFVQFCTGFIFCSLQENKTAKFDYQSRLFQIKMDIKLFPRSVQFHHGDDIYCMGVHKKKKENTKCCHVSILIETNFLLIMCIIYLNKTVLSYIIFYSIILIVRPM